MSFDSNILIEPYLQELVQNRESSRLKLLAAWDGLSVETQIKILKVIRPIPSALKLKALCSPNAYVRYLIADRFIHAYSESDNSLLEKISADESILVRFTNCPSQKVYVDEENKSVLKPENFFSITSFALI